MKQLYLIFAFALIFSCSKNSNDVTRNQTLFLSFDLDTVMVDAGDDVINLRNGLHFSGLSADEKSLFIFNREDNQVEVIDMESLRLSHKIPYEQEGPNGTGSVFGFQNLMDGKFMLSDFTSFGVFTESGQKIDSHKFSDLTNGTFEDDEQIVANGILSEEGKVFFGFYSKGGLGYKGISMLDMEAGSIKRIPVAELEAMDNFTVDFNNRSQQMKFNMTGNYISWHKGRVLMSNTFENRIIIYDPEKDSLSSHSFHSQLTPDFAKEISKKNVGTQEEFQEIRKAFEREVSFGKWLHDPSNERFYRLTSLLEKESEDQKEYKVVLTVLDRDLKQIFEGITPLNKNYFSMFVKGSKLYLYENMYDELGFIVLTLNEN